MKYLGIDYGKSKMGLAISEGQIASAFKVLSIKSLGGAIRYIDEIVKLEKVERIVIGMPDSGEAAKLSKRLINDLQIHYLKQKVEVIEADETLSSYQAKNLMRELGLSKKHRQDEDAYSAVIILQNFLDSLQ